jgi:hypothetical protein
MRSNVRAFISSLIILIVLILALFSSPHPLSGKAILPTGGRLKLVLLAIFSLFLILLTIFPPEAEDVKDKIIEKILERYKSGEINNWGREFRYITKSLSRIPDKNLRYATRTDIILEIMKNVDKKDSYNIWRDFTEYVEREQIIELKH